MSDPQHQQPRPPSGFGFGPDPRSLLIAAAVVVVGLFALWFFAIRDGDDAGDSPQGGAAGRNGAEPVTVSTRELRSIAADSSFPIYWAGPPEGSTVELTETGDGRLYVRYLEDAEADDPRPAFLTVGSYSLPGAYEVLSEYAESDGAVPVETEDDSVAVYAEDIPTSVYVAYPDVPVQIEVYDPDPEQALEVATSGRLELVAP